MRDIGNAGVLFLMFGMVLPALAGRVDGAELGQPVYPGTEWEQRTPEQAGLSGTRLKALAELAGGQGCVVRNGFLVYTWGDPTRSGDIASAVKPIVSTLLLLAVQHGKLASVDAKVSDFEPGLLKLNSGKDAGITWQHLASQTSGYGLVEPPGKAYGYNDFALALYYDTLMQRVYKQDGNRVLKEQLGDILGFQDKYAFEAFGPKDRPGRLAISVRDLARFGLLYLRGGRWRDQQVLKPESVRLALSSLVPVELSRTSGQDAEMLPNQRSLGGAKDQTSVGPGMYSFNWWVNRTDRNGNRLFADLPSDTFVASGHGGKRALWVLPSLDLVVAWNDTSIADHDDNLKNPNTKFNQAARLIRDTVQRETRVSIGNDRWLINGAVTYRGAKAEGLLMNVRMVNAVFENPRHADFDPAANTNRFLEKIPDYVAHGVRAFTLNFQGGMPGYEGAVNSAFDADGNLREAYLGRVRRVIEACDRHGAVVILGCFYQRQDQVLKDEAAVRSGVVNTAQWIKGCGFNNVLLEVANEFGHGGFDHKILKTVAGQIELITLARKTHPALLVSTSDVSNATVPREIAEAADFLLVHFNATKLDDIPRRIRALREVGKPVLCNEDTKTGDVGAKAAELCVSASGSWGLMLEKVNQHEPFTFSGAADDESVYRTLKQLTTP
ncbi:MAG: serine hydrolase [Planctomycetes bacterium]|nr:serine hydrolase [Planctomycetota bacterium]